MSDTRPADGDEPRGATAAPDASPGQNGASSEMADDAEVAEAPPQAQAADSEGLTAEDEAVPAEELAAELAETKERLLRALAETENLRRRSARELEDARKYAVSGFARELLDVADNLARALESVPAQAREEIDFVKNLAEGVAMTERSLLACFERHQIAKVEPAPGASFDPNRHQAMFEMESSEHPPGTIAQVMQPGYVIADRLLRPAMVGVARAPSEAAVPEAAEAPADGGAPQAGIAPGDRIDTTA